MVIPLNRRAFIKSLAIPFLLPGCRKETNSREQVIPSSSLKVVSAEPELTAEEEKQQKDFIDELKTIAKETDKVIFYTNLDGYCCRFLEYISLKEEKRELRKPFRDLFVALESFSKAYLESSGQMKRKFEFKYTPLYAESKTRSLNQSERRANEWIKLNQLVIDIQHWSNEEIKSRRQKPQK